LGEILPVLDHGFIYLVDYLGGDADIARAARVSYGEGTRSVSEDRTLIRYLMRHNHTSPFEWWNLNFMPRCRFLWLDNGLGTERQV